MKEEIIIRNYNPEEELEWLDLHASVMVDSHAWWIVNHKKPVHKNPVVDLVACFKSKLVGFTVAEINIDSSDAKKSEAFVWDFGVHREYRKKKTGKKMIEELHKIMNEKFGISKSIWYSQEPDSIKYYEYLGMKEIGRHWQFSAYPAPELIEFCKENKFYLQNLRCTCNIDKLDEVRKKFKLMDDDETLKPMICVGFEFVM